MIRFYALPLSTYCTKVRIVLRIKGASFEELPPHDGHYSSDAYQRHMPPGTLPSIEVDGFKLFDSEAIVEYLEDIYPSPRMHSLDPEVRARQRAIAQFHNTRVEPAVRALFPLVKRRSAKDAQENLEELHAGFEQQLLKLKQVIAPDPFIGGSKPCLADCGFPATLRMGQDIFRFLGIQATLDSELVAWLEALEDHAIIGEEIGLNRRAIAKWLEGFS